MNTNSFALRHIGPRESDLREMLDTVGAESLEQLIYETIPDDIRLKEELKLDPALSENEYITHILKMASKNKIFKTYIGLGYHETILPPVIQRNIFENPGWYTAYTPYQAEIAQGRLEALLNFQTMVSDLTGMDLANASLLDEPTAVAEGMTLMYNLRSRALKKENIKKIFVAEDIFPQTKEVLQSRSKPLGIELVYGDPKSFDFESTKVFGAILQYPNVDGAVFDYSDFVKRAHKAEVLVTVAADLLS